MANKDVVPLPCDTIEMVESQSECESQIEANGSSASQESQEIWTGPGVEESAEPESGEKVSETVNGILEWAITNKISVIQT